jgi:hypothetical protein
MRKCPYCGKEYADDVAFCAIDGESLTPQFDLPVNQEQKEWIEQSFQWLLENFGRDNFLKHKTILPEPSFFPDKYNSTEESVDAIVKRVCGYMDVNPDTVEVIFLVERDESLLEHGHGEQKHSGAAGLYFSKTSTETRKKIAVNVELFNNPTKLVGTIAHELGHVILLGGGKIERTREDHEHLTDLLTVFFGLGIFTANSAFQFSQWQDHSRSWWKVSRAGYLSEETFGYALAAYAWMRNDMKTPWSKYLAMNVGHYFRQCLKYFEKGGPTSLCRLSQ